MSMIRKLEEIQKEREKIEEEYRSKLEKLCDREKELTGVSYGQVLDVVTLAKCIHKAIEEGK